MKHNPDDRSDNAEKIKKNIDKTLMNMELADEMIGSTPDVKMQKALKDKNTRRMNALNALRRELEDEQGQ